MGELDSVRSALIDALVDGAIDTIDLPHVVVMEAGRDVQVCGPYACGFDALVAAQRLHDEDPDLVLTAVALRPPT